MYVVVAEGAVHTTLAECACYNSTQQQPLSSATNRVNREVRLALTWFCGVWPCLLKVTRCARFGHCLSKIPL